jgi:hypothetical protein
MDTASPIPVLSIDDQMIQLIGSLSDEWKQTAKERIRLQRLTLDYRQEFEQIGEENRKYTFIVLKENQLFKQKVNES